MYNTTLHEIGHALGIIGHSSVRSDIMSTADVRYIYSNNDATEIGDGKVFYYQIKSSNTYRPHERLLLSKRDINTIRLLYRLDTRRLFLDTDNNGESVCGPDY